MKRNIVEMKNDLTDDKHDGSSDHAEDDHVVYCHADQPGIVDLTNFHRSGFVSEKQAQYQLETRVTVNDT